MKRIRRIWLLGLLVCGMLMLPVRTVEAAGTKTTTGTCEYDKAYKVLEKVNAERVAAGQSKLVMDKDLLKAAMLRAAELTVEFNHIRPNGEVCFTVCDKMYAENIAYGQTSATEVMESWMASGGHRTNILNGSYKSIGIGCFYKDGVRYWAQCFGYESATAVKQPANVKRTYQVSLTEGVDTKVKSEETVNTTTTTKTYNVTSLKATAGKRKLTVKWKKVTGVDGYQLQISTTKSFKKKQSYNISKNTKKKTITKYKGKKLKAKKRYYVRIRSYIKVDNDSGKTIKKYSKWKTISKKTK